MSASLAQNAAGLNATRARLSQTEQGVPGHFFGFYSAGSNAARPAGCHTDSAGDCTFAAMVGPQIRFNVLPPIGLGNRITATATETANTTTVPLTYFARAESARTIDGRVDLASPPGTTLAGVGAEWVDQSALPDGAEPVVGGVAFRVSGVRHGQTIEVSMRLPSGSEPNAVYKLINGSYVTSPRSRPSRKTR
jgi:hypothetical protein